MVIVWLNVGGGCGILLGFWVGKWVVDESVCGAK